MGKALSAAIRAAGHIERGICYAALISMALLPVAVALLRPFHIPIPHASSFLPHLFLVVGLFAAMITTQAKQHISISVIQYAKNEKLKNTLSFAAGFLSILVATILFWNCLSLFRHSPAGRTV
ncbi:MAG: TRAP transporter small permease, partial [Treponema sp.]|nr:TRAP transporter small permease [Treponema sp.]